MRKTNRLLRNEDFTRVLNNGKKIRDDSFLIAAVANKLGKLRVGISVSKKVGNAVTRVKVRRQIRAMFDTLDLVDEGMDLVVIPKPNFLNREYKDNLERLTKAITVLLSHGSNK